MGGLSAVACAFSLDRGDISGHMIPYLSILAGCVESEVEIHGCAAMIVDEIYVGIRQAAVSEKQGIGALICQIGHYPVALQECSQRFIGGRFVNSSSRFFQLRDFLSD